MTPPQRLQVELLSDTTVSRGWGSSGGVDVEVEHDRWGLPFIRGSLLFGLMREAWLSMAPVFPDLTQAADPLFGPAGYHLNLGDAELPPDLQSWARFAVQRQDHPLTANQVLRTLTDLRSQGGRERVVLRGLRFSAPLTWPAPPSPAQVQVLALASLAVRHLGQGRGRGRGHIMICLDGDADATRQIARGSGAPV
jgi:hypothetical protein